MWCSEPDMAGTVAEAGAVSVCVCVRVPDGVIAAGDTDADTASHGGSDDDDDAGGGDGGGGGGQATDASLQVYDMGHSRVHFAQRTHGSMRMLVVRPLLLSAHPARTVLLTHTPTVLCRAQAVFMEPDLPLDLGAATAADLGARFSAKYAARLDACPAGGVPTVCSVVFVCACP